MSNVVFDAVDTTFVTNWSNTAQTTIQISANHYDISLNSSSNTILIQVSGNMNANISCSQSSVNVNVSSNQFVVHLTSYNGVPYIFNLPKAQLDLNFNHLARIFNLDTVPAGGQKFSANTTFQAASQITILASILANSNNTNYPSLVSYGMDNASPWETYVLQAQSTDGNHPADFYFLTANTANLAQSVSHQLFGNTKLLSNTFYALAVTYDGVHANLYLNGNLERTGNATGPLFYYGTNGLGIGTKFNLANSAFNGTVSNVSIYNYALTTNQILTAYQNQITGNSNGSSNSVTGYAAWNPPFPRKHLNAIGGVQTFTDNSVLALFSKFDSVVLGANWEGWSGSGRNMYNTVANIKSVSTNTAPNGTLVFMYLDCVGGYAPTPNVGSSVTANVNDPTPIMTKEMANNNWWLYTTGSSGAIDTSPNYYNHQNFAAPNLTAAYAGTNWKGETPYQYCAAYSFNLRLGNSGDFRFSTLLNNNKANNADGMFLDNMWRGPFITADFLRSGSSQTTTSADGTVADALSNGEAQYFIRLQQIANSVNRSIMSFGNFGDYGKATAVTNNFNQIMHGGLLEEYFGLSNSPDTWSTYAAMQAMYARAIAICQPPQHVILHGYFPADSSSVPQQTEWQWARYIIGSSCMQNGAASVNRKSQGYSADTAAEVGWYDEWNYNIGYPIAGPAGAPQTAANTNGLWMRQFQNTTTGKKYLWVVNPAKNGTQNVTTANIGGAGIWQFIPGTQDPANNTGAVINTSFTLLERDARLLISV